MSDTIIDVKASKSNSSAADIVVRVLLVALAFVGVQLPLIEVVNSGSAASYNALFHLFLGGFGYAVPAAVAVLSVLGFLSGVGVVRKIADGLVLAIPVVSGGYMAFVVYHVATNAPGSSSSSVAMSLGLGGYAYIALIVLAAWNLFSSLRR